MFETFDGKVAYDKAEKDDVKQKHDNMINLCDIGFIIDLQQIA